jgi:eukaryotic-like serine/threonine-protein kinase
MLSGADHWQNVKKLYEAASALPVDQRSSFLERNSRNAAIRQEVESLLAFHTASGEFLEFAEETGDSLPTQIGSYRLVCELDRGGMSRVWLAERSDGEFNRQVAIKFLGDGIFGDDVRRRFRQERQLLASFDHPNIVKLIDGGVLEDGRPYLIAEWIEGLPLTAYAREGGLDIRQRLMLFADLCSAVAYAHAHSVGFRHRQAARLRR